MQIYRTWVRNSVILTREKLCTEVNENRVDTPGELHAAEQKFNKGRWGSKLKTRLSNKNKTSQKNSWKKV